MKKLFLLSAVFAAGLLTSCSSDKDVDSSPDLTGKVDPNGNSYINVAFNLPTELTRAAGITDTDGTAEEYQVNDAILLVFGNSTDNEQTATFKYAKTVDIASHAAGSGEIESVREQAVSLTKDALSSNHTYLYAILNGIKSGAVTFDGTNFKVNVSTDGSTETATPLESTTTFAQFLAMQVKAAAIGQKAYDDTGTLDGGGFLMTNAPLANKGGGSNNPSSATIKWLTKLNMNNVYSSATEAAGGTATEIYVERAAAKIELAGSSITFISGGTNISADASKIKWTVDNTEKTFFANRNITNTAFGYKSEVTGTGAPTMTYRFVDDNATAAGLYRIHWAEDPHYATGASSTAWSAWDTWTTGDAASFTTLSGPENLSSLTKNLSTNNVVYCAENTSKWNEQKKSTRLVIAVPLNVTSGTVNPFYTIPDLSGKDYLLKDKNAVAEQLKEIIKASSTYTSLKTKITDAISGTFDETKISIDITVTDQSDNKSAKATAVTLTYTNGSDTYSDASNNSGALNTEALNLIKDIKINWYKDGYAYYKLMVQHFGQDDTWLDPSNTNGDYTMYGADETAQMRDYLGRFGVVRNHWYSITLSEVLHIGEPSIPEPPTTPDDEVNTYIKCKINITKWAKHTQTGVKI